MKTASFFTAAALFASSTLAATIPTDPNAAFAQLQSLIAQTSTDLKTDIVSGNVTKRSTCSLANVKIRREWNALSSSEKKAYTKAVQCLQSKSAQSPASFAAGAKTRFDDWVATHIDQTLTIHYTGTFLGWHRYFLWEYENALINECGYTGTQPYWNWGLTALTGLEQSSIFDGSATSMSGNGAKVDETGQNIVLNLAGTAPLVLPVGTGGGCVTSGPFASMSVNLGPAGLGVPSNSTTEGATVASPDGPMSYNPRCLKRDLTTAINQKYAGPSAIVSNILKPQTIYDFQMQLQGVPGSGNIGVHGGGHYSLGGDPGRDLFTSPGDPMFYLHHAMVDLVWTMWQMQDPARRQYGANAIAGTNTYLNMPPSPDTTFSTPISIGYAGRQKTVTMNDVMSTLDGDFCYIYI